MKVNYEFIDKINKFSILLTKNKFTILHSLNLK